VSNSLAERQRTAEQESNRPFFERGPICRNAAPPRSYVGGQIPVDGIRQEFCAATEPHPVKVLINAKSWLDEGPGLTVLGRESSQIQLAGAPCEREPAPETQREAEGRQRQNRRGNLNGSVLSIDTK